MTRARILAAAREQFAKHGYTATSMRSVAAAAGIDASLIAHYFGSKQGLLVAALELPVDPLEQITAVIATGPDGLGERLIRTFLASWDDHREAFATLAITALTRSATTPAVSVIDLARDVLAVAIAPLVGGDAARAQLVAAQVIGIGVARYVAAIEPLASAPIDAIAPRYGRAIQTIIDD